MKSRVVTIWRCDFCSRKNFTKPAMERHEKTCADNPNRVCSICTGDPQTGAKDLPELIAYLRANAKRDQGDFAYIDEENHVAALRELADGCPLCMLAAVKQSGVYMNAWNYREEATAFWKRWHEMQAAEMRSIIGGVSS